MYKRSELLYFWHDSHYLNLIVIITINRSRYHTNAPFSASIFRLRGHDSVQMFLQRAQQFFAQLLVSNIPRDNSQVSVQNWISDDNTKKDRKKSKHHSTTNEQSITKSSHSRTTTPIRLITRAEFDPGKTKPVSHSNDHRTYSETTVSSDTQTSSLKETNPKDEKTTTVNNHLSGEHMIDLMRELKELRNEIAALKLEARFTPVRSTSTSPLPQFAENTRQRMNSSSQSEINAETQTDLSLMDPKPMVYSNQEKPSLINSSQMNGVPTASLIKPRPILKTQQNGVTYLNGSNKHEKKIPIQTGEVISFHSSLKNTIALPDNIYENLPVVLNTNSNQDFYYNIPIINRTNQSPIKSPVHVTIAADENSQLQQEYLSQLFGPQNGISLLIPQESLPSLSNNEIPTVTNNNHQYFQQITFADHLTNPLFNVDKQLLANTIANQFGVDVNSPYLQKLITHQHLFLANKRSFANMVWQITPEEENVLCSSPLITTTSSNINNINTVDSNSSTAKSILKFNKPPRLIPKGQRISWDRTLE
jgi:hypothetical protein